MGLYGSQELTGKERTFAPDELIVTKTDLSGKLTYVNRTFLKISDYDEDECLGVQHNVIRHPEMPRAVFELFWRTIQAGEEIFAFVNNRSKNGDNYWVLAHVTPSRDLSGNIVGYHSNRRVPERTILEERIKPLYAELLSIERSAQSPKEGLEASLKTVLGMLKNSNATFNQFMFSLGI